MQDLERIRFRPEIRLLKTLQERFDIESLLRHLESQEFWPHYQLVLAQQVRLTPILAPRVFRIFNEVRETLEFDEETDLFVQPEPTINAFALHSLAPGTPHAISVTSEMIKSMTDEELRFAMGHEVGHLLFRHYRVNLLFDLFEEDPSLPRLLEARLQTWSRLAELSADRVGFMAARQNLEAAVGTFFKLASGLGPEHLSFDLDTYLRQLKDLQRHDRKDIFALFSHPITPVRVRALQVYAESGGSVASDAHLVGVDREVEKLAKLMEYEVSTELGVQALDFLVSGGLLAASADGDLAEEEQEMLVQLLLQFTGDPETHLERIGTAEEAQRLLENCVTWLRNNAGEERYELYRQLSHIVGVDGRLDERENAFMKQVANMLAIPPKAAGEIVYEVLAGFVQRNASTPMTRFRFREEEEAPRPAKTEKPRVITIPG